MKMMKKTEKPTLQEFHIDGVKHISPPDAMEAVANHKAVIIDVREEAELKTEGIALDNVLFHPMSVIMDRLQYISKDQNIILACPGGVRSTKVANLLNIQGYPSVANLDGGFMMWKLHGLPFRNNQKVSSGCGCGCSAASPNENSGSCC